VPTLRGQITKEFDGEVLLYCYEAGPCGYGFYGQLKDLGQDCPVVAPSLIRKKVGERIKTDRRDASKLAHDLRAGNLTAVWVPISNTETQCGKNRSIRKDRTLCIDRPTRIPSRPPIGFKS
jgi:transposase